MSAGLSQLLDLRLKTLRALSLFFSTPAIKITADSYLYILNLQVGIEIYVEYGLLKVYQSLNQV